MGKRLTDAETRKSDKNPHGDWRNILHGGHADQGNRGLSFAMDLIYNLKGGKSGISGNLDALGSSL